MRARGPETRVLATAALISLLAACEGRDGGRETTAPRPDAGLGAGREAGAATEPPPIDPGEPLFPIQANEGCGFIDRQGKVVIPPTAKLTTCRGFGSKELGPFADGDRYGYLNARGEVVVPPRYEDAGLFSEGLAEVQRPAELEGPRARPGVARRGYIDATGREVIAPRFRLTGPFSEGLAAAQDDSLLFGYIDRTGRYVIPPRFVEASPFSEGLAVVGMVHSVGAIDRSGELVIPLTEEDPRLDRYPFSEGLNVAHRARNECGYVDRTGRVAIPLRFHFFCLPFAEHRAAVLLTRGEEDAGAWGFVDPAGELVIPAQFEEVGHFDGGLAPARIGGRWGFIRPDGSWAIAPRFDGAGSFAHGLAPVAVGGRWRYVDREGAEVWAPSTEVVSGRELPVVELVKTDVSAIATAERRVIRTSAELDALWSRAQLDRYAPQTGPPPQLRFEQLDVIAVSQDEMPSLGSGIRVDRVVDTGAEVVVFVTERVPQSSCEVQDAVTAPLHVVSVPRVDRPHRFVTTRVDACLVDEP